MNIAVTGEGKTDYGIKEYGSMTWKWGPIAYYIKKIANEQGVEVALSPISREDIRDFRLQLIIFTLKR